MNQLFQRLLGAIEASKSQTPAATAVDEALHVLTAQQAQAVACGPTIENDPT